MESFTSGRVSAMARKAWLADPCRASRDCAFLPVRDGYEMIAWESEIAMCRAMGRGAATGKGRPVHKFDLLPTASERPQLVPVKLAPRW